MSNHIVFRSPAATTAEEEKTSDYRIQAPNVDAMEVRPGPHAERAGACSGGGRRRRLLPPARSNACPH